MHGRCPLGSGIDPRLGRAAGRKEYMQTLEVTNWVLRVVDESKSMKLSESEQHFYLNLSEAVVRYQQEVQQERRCRICGVPVSQCCC